jgi:hypothetical protein
MMDTPILVGSIHCASCGIDVPLETLFKVYRPNEDFITYTHTCGLHLLSVIQREPHCLEIRSAVNNPFVIHTMVVNNVPNRLRNN